MVSNRSTNLVTKDEKAAYHRNYNRTYRKTEKHRQYIKAYNEKWRVRHKNRDIDLSQYPVSGRDIVRFMSSVSPEPNSGCWLWIGAAANDGRGSLHWRGKVRVATHAAWDIYKGELPTFHILHRCDTPACVREDHLFEGTEADNHRDKVRKGRWGGDKTPGHKLNWEQVFCIRGSRERAALLADRYGVSAGTIYAIRAGDTWRFPPSSSGGPITDYPGSGSM